MEVYCSEPLDFSRNADYFKKNGFAVKVRDYGTPQYKEVLLLSENDKPAYEIRRLPYSLREQGGIFPRGACHIRLSNRACYQPNCIDSLRWFLMKHGYTYNSISRIDICMDFNSFDNLANPLNIIRKYMRGDISKINQCKVAAHGADAWDGRSWNSLKWGSPNSSVSTKLYNKTLEMKEQKRKFYIEDVWQAAGLLNDDAHPVWRVEFSLKSDIKGLIKMDSGELIENKLTTYDSPERLLHIFSMYAGRYFHFKTIVRTREGNIQRKDRCPDLPLFKISPQDSVVKLFKPTLQKEPDRTDKMLIKRLREISKTETNAAEYRKAAKNLAQELTAKNEKMHRDVVYALALIAKRNDMSIQLRKNAIAVLNYYRDVYRCDTPEADIFFLEEEK